MGTCKKKRPRHDSEWDERSRKLTLREKNQYSQKLNERRPGFRKGVGEGDGSIRGRREKGKKQTARKKRRTHFLVFCGNGAQVSRREGSKKWQRNEKKGKEKK